jgi:hypothetical protein
MPDRGGMRSRTHVRSSRPGQLEGRGPRGFRGRILRCLSGMPRSEQGAQCTFRRPRSTSRLGRSPRGPGAESRRLAGKSPRAAVPARRRRKCSRSSREGGPSAMMRAAVHDRDDIAQEVGLLHVVRREKHGAPFALDGADEVPRIMAGLGGRARSSARSRKSTCGSFARASRAGGAASARRTACGCRDPRFRRARRSRSARRPRAPRVQVAEERERLAHCQELLERGFLELDARLLAKRAPSGSPR